MIKPEFKLGARNRYAIYARMSDEKQNTRSPDQQVEMIRHQLRLSGFHWEEVAIYTDRHVSGRLTERRPEYHRLRHDIINRRIEIDILLVDTFDRFSRAREAVILREELYQAGVVLMTADSNFTDPTTGAGELLAFFEAWRAREDNRVKSHMVLRGKRDIAQLGLWPGGPAPLGYALERVDRSLVPGATANSCRLVPDPASRWIIQRMFELADTMGWGTVRIAKALNEDAKIPDQYKPFVPASVGRRLASNIYVGELIWERHHYDVRRDSRIVQRTGEEEWIKYPGFCEPLVDFAQFVRVNEVRERRAARILERNPAAYDGKSRCGSGIALRYLLSGLVTCGCCGLAMTISVTKPYVTADGVSKTYPSYICPSRGSGNCHNTSRISEPWLREEVVKLVRSRLFGQPVIGDSCNMSSASVKKAPWYEELLSLVEKERQRIVSERPDQRRMLEGQRKEIINQQEGRAASLRRHDLPDSLRRQFEDEYGAADVLLRKIECDLSSTEAQTRELTRVVDASEIAVALNSLGTILGSQNISAGNLVLAQHLAAIECHPGGRIVVRSCKLGALSDRAEIIVRNHSAKDTGTKLEAPRQRTRRRVECASEADENLEAMNYTVLNPSRFAGLGPEWFWVDSLQVPTRRTWPEEHALEVANFRLAHRVSQKATALHFKVSVPTVRIALRIAQDLGVDATDGAMKMARKPNWAKANALAVTRFVDSGATLREAAGHFGVSEPTIAKALTFARVMHTG